MSSKPSKIDIAIIATLVFWTVTVAGALICQGIDFYRRVFG